MLNIKLINRLICLEQVIDAMFKDDAPDIAEALKVCINVIFGDMVADHANAIEQQYFSDKEVENKIRDVEEIIRKKCQFQIEKDVDQIGCRDVSPELANLSQQLDHIKQIQSLYSQLKDKK
jgi:hypothetical protein